MDKDTPAGRTAADIRVQLRGMLPPGEDIPVVLRMPVDKVRALSDTIRALGDKLRAGTAGRDCSIPPAQPVVPAAGKHTAAEARHSLREVAGRRRAGSTALRRGSRLGCHKLGAVRSQGTVQRVDTDMRVGILRGLGMEDTTVAPRLGRLRWVQSPRRWLGIRPQRWRMRWWEQTSERRCPAKRLMMRELGKSRTGPGCWGIQW